MIWKGIARLASLRLTLVILLLLGCGVLWSYHSPVRTTWGLALPLFLSAVNLLAAILTRPVFRRQSGLLVFHLALLAIILLAAVGRLSYLKGQLELAEGERFSGNLAVYEQGPWHSGHLDRVSFVNQGYSIDYAPGIRRRNTENRVRWRDAQGQEHTTVIGDHRPLVLEGYRFYTSFNKGFAPTFVWYPQGGGEPQRGTINLPSYPIHQYGQALAWTPPGATRELWTLLDFDETILDPDKPSQFRLPETHKLIIRIEDERHELQPGEWLPTAEGTLLYEELRSWMGYTVFYDWTLPWLLAACVVAVLSLGWHFWSKFAAKPWLREQEAAKQEPSNQRVTVADASSDSFHPRFYSHGN